MKTVTWLVGEDTVLLVGRAVKLTIFFGLTILMSQTLPILLPAVAMVGAVIATKG